MLWSPQYIEGHKSHTMIEMGDLRISMCSISTEMLIKGHNISVVCYYCVGAEMKDIIHRYYCV